MVEARGFEPLSEKAVIGASTSVSCALSFALSAPAGGIELQLSCKIPLGLTGMGLWVVDLS